MHSLRSLGQLGFCGHKRNPLQLTQAKRDFSEKPLAAHGTDFEAREKDLERTRNQGRHKGRNTPRAKNDLAGWNRTADSISVFVPLLNIRTHGGSTWLAKAGWCMQLAGEGMVTDCGCTNLHPGGKSSGAVKKEKDIC